ncbi:autoinducer binding domain-containing protein [Ruegeria sp. HKCCD8929]|uniref:helix-turn-helix transcriptional regulator n=1 Tax=Ruegeria sp. HKCCD8929 TaxID=2683006 RepID=UPI001487D66D|nr:autoinducer binding domain-containing protein [Ruegeria sp. HKCCD8929]
MDESIPKVDREILQISEKVELHFRPMKELLNSLDVKWYTLLVNYSVRGYEHFDSTYPEDWQIEYDSKNYHVGDPALMWSMFKEGYIRWSEIKIPDIRGVWRRARAFDLNFGASFSHRSAGKRTVIYLAKPDREFSDKELIMVADEMERFVRHVAPGDLLTEREVDVLKLYTEGLSFREVGAELNITESAAKERIASAKRKLECKSTAHLIRKVIEEQLLD